jgi:hypothetical protein
MKRFLSVIVISILASIFFFCNSNNDNVSQHRKRISKIYYQDYGKSKKLIEKWTWEGENLSRITSRDDSCFWDFHYNDNHIEKIVHSAGDYYAFSYIDKFIKRIAFYISSGDLVETYEFEHSKNKITTVTHTFYGYKNILPNISHKIMVLRCFLPLPIVDKLFPERKLQASTTKGKPVFIDVYEYAWDRNKIKSISYRRGTKNESDYITFESMYHYDRKDNPFYYSLISNDILEMNNVSDTNWMKWNILQSNRNIIYQEVFVSDGRKFKEQYDITYEGKFPNEIRISTEYAGVEGEYIETYFYTYN